MAAKDNYWDPARNEWIDGATGNHMKPTDQGGDGLWYSPDNSQKLLNGNWVPATSSSSSGSGFSPQAGSEYTLAEINNRHDAEQQRLRLASEAQLQQAQGQIQLQLSQGQITSAQAIQARTLAQQESEFARTLAFNQLSQQQSQELQQAQLQITKAAEVRNERTTQANLAANPIDWVAYEFYKRALGAPAGEKGALTTPAGTLPVQSGTPSGVTPIAGTGTEPATNINAYSAAPPAYGDPAIQSIAANLFNGNSNGLSPAYDPGLSGQGVFGTAIKSPNSLSRSAFGSLSNSEMSMLAGLLKAGVNIGGKQVALDPNEYFQQVQNSWIPTFGSSAWQRLDQSSMPQYR